MDSFSARRAWFQTTFSALNISALHFLSSAYPLQEFTMKLALQRKQLVHLVSLIVLGLSLTPPVYADVPLTTHNGIPVTVHDAGYGAISSSSAISDWPLLCVQPACNAGTCVPCEASHFYHAGGAQSTIELAGRQIVTAPVILNGVQVIRRVYVPNSGPIDADGYIRILDSLYNPASQPVTLSVSLGSLAQPVHSVGGAGSQIWRTSSYDATLTLADRWLLIDDQDASGGSPNTVVIFQGSGGHAPDEISYDPISKQLSWRYQQITIPAHQTVNLITVIQLEDDREAALIETQGLLRFRPVDVTFGLGSSDIRAIYNVDLNPDNASPLADLNGPYNGNEGQEIQLSGSASYDQEDAVLTYRWDLDDDQIFGEPGLESSGPNVRITFPQDGDYPVALEVEDSGGKIDRDFVIVNVRNVKPVLTNLITNSPINEGGLLEVRVEGSDVGAEDVITYAADWEGTGLFEPIPSITSRRYHRDGVFFGQIRLSDQDGGETLAPLNIVVNNLPPVIQQVIASNPSSEGSEATFRVQAIDPGLDPLTYRFDFDRDGVIDEVNQTGEARFTFLDEGNYSVRIEVNDDAGAVASIDYPMLVLNSAPVISDLIIDQGAVEGTPVTITVNASDAGIFDLLTYEFDLDGQEGFEISQSEPTLEYTFPDSGLITVTVRVTDGESAFATQSTEVIVSNLPPTGVLRFEGANVREGVVATGDQGRPFEVVVEGDDPSQIDAASLIYNWDLDGDGVYELLAADARQTLLFNAEGEYTIRCLIRDKDLGEVMISREVLIAGRPPELRSLEITSDGPYIEGLPVTFHLDANDPDPMTYSFDFNGDGEFELIGPNPTVRWEFRDEGHYIVVARVSDETGFVEQSIEIDVENAAPTLELNTGVNVGEGEDLNIEVTARDSGIDDVISVTVQFQGQIEEFDLYPDASRRFTLPTQDNGFIDITATAVDDAGAQSAFYSARAFIENRPPFIPPFIPSPAIEGSSYSQVIPADDPAGLNDALFFSLIEPPENVEIDRISGLLLWNPTYEDFLNSPITFDLLIEDEDGGRLERAVTIPVLPRDEDADGIPDTYEQMSCERFSPCLDSGDPDDAALDSDGDGRSNLEEWADGTEPFLFEGPSTPIQLSPGEGEVVNALPMSLVASHVTSERPLPLNPDGSLAAREIMFEYEVYADQMAEALIIASEPQMMRSINDQETNSWLLDTDELIEDQLYWWRVRALDGPAISEWSSLRSFRINVQNRAPAAPELSLPLNGSTVADLRPTLTFVPSADPDGEDVYFVVRVYRETPEGLIVDFGGQVEGEEDLLSLIPSTRLQENARYHWDVVAIDEVGLESEPSDRWSFVVDLENEPPTDPIILTPEYGETLDTLRPTLRGAGSVDQEGAPLSYHFQVRAVGDMELIAETEAEGVITTSGVAEWIPEVDLYEDREHIVSLYVSDGVTQTGVVSKHFYVSAEDNAPPIPTLLDPIDNALVTPRDAILIWSEERDPERGITRYQVEYCSPEGDCAESDLLNSNSFSLNGLIPTKKVYSWRVRSTDEAGHSLGYSAPRYLTIIKSTSQNSQQDEGCQQSERSPSYMILLILFLFHLRRPLIREQAH